MNIKNFTNYKMNCFGNIKNLFFLFIFIISITNISMSSSNIKSFNLDKKNYLIIKQNGIYTYNKDTLKTEKKYLFKNEEQKYISTNETRKIFYFKNIYPQANIFLFIEHYVYILSLNGEYIKSSKIFDKSPTNFYNIVFPNKYIDTNSGIYYYYYILVYNSKSNILIYVFKYDYYSNQNILLFSKEVYLPKEKIINNNIRFQLIPKNKYQDIIVLYSKNNKNYKKIIATFKINIYNKVIQNLLDFDNDEKNLINIYLNSHFNKYSKISNNIRYLEGEINPDDNPSSSQSEENQKESPENPDDNSSGNQPEENHNESPENPDNSGGGTNDGENQDQNNDDNLDRGDDNKNNNEQQGQNDQNNQNKRNNNFNFDFEKGQTNMTKNEIRNNRDSLMQDYEHGKSFKIEGDGFEIKVAPMNEKGEQGSTYIDFLSCETKLREANGLNESAVLSVFQTQTESTNERSLTNRVSYVVYDENNNQLDLSVCENEQIRINYALRNDTSLNTTMLSRFADKGIDILNSSDPFFNDICYSYSDSGSDMILKDRISEVYQNFSICDNGCEYESIDTENLTVSCSCSVSNDTDSDDEEESTNVKDIILNLFEDSTFGVIKCYKLVFDFSNKLKNIGFWIFSVIIIGHIPLYILFFLNGITPIKQYIVNEMKKFHYFANITEPPKKKIKIKKKVKLRNDNMKSQQTTTENIQETEAPDKKINDLSTNIKNFKKTNIVPIQHNNLINEIENTKRTELNDMLTQSQNSQINKIDEKNNNKNTYSLIRIDANNVNNISKPQESNYTLKNYEYETAIEHDKRTFWRILYIVLLAKDNLLNTVLLKSPLESQPLRICLLLFSYTSDLALNTLFYFSDNISDKYHYTGNSLFWFTLFNNIFISLISTLLSLILGSILSSMTNSKNSIEKEFKNEEKKMRENLSYVVSDERKNEILNSITKSLRCLKIKMVIFVIVDLLLLLFFYYFTTAFCSVYQGTQTSWITDAIVSIIIAIPIEIAIALVVTIVYKIALRYKCKFLYNISMIFA